MDDVLHRRVLRAQEKILGIQLAQQAGWGEERSFCVQRCSCCHRSHPPTSCPGNPPHTHIPLHATHRCSSRAGDHCVAADELPTAVAGVRGSDRQCARYTVSPAGHCRAVVEAVVEGGQRRVGRLTRVEQNRQAQQASTPGSQAELAARPGSCGLFTPDGSPPKSAEQLAAHPC